MKKKLVVLSGIVLGTAPLLVLAQTATGGSVQSCGVGSNQDALVIFCRLGQILSAILPLLVALGVVYLVWGIVQYVIGGDDEAKEKGKTKIIYGIIGLAVIVGLWGLVHILTQTFGLNNQTNITLPTVQQYNP